MNRMRFAAALLATSLVSAPAFAQFIVRPYAGVDTNGKAHAADGRMHDAAFEAPSGITADWTGMLYVADSFGLRQVNGANVITVAGAPGSSGTNDGNGKSARFRNAHGAAVDRWGNVFVIDGNAVRKLDTDGVVTTIAGDPDEAGTSDGHGRSARFDAPQSVAVDWDGNLYVADTNNATVRRIGNDGMVTTVAGVAKTKGHGDGHGNGARFMTPAAVAADRNGNVLVTDTDDQTVRRIDANGDVTTIAGDAGASGTSDGRGRSAKFNQPRWVTNDWRGGYFVADAKSVRRVTVEGAVTTLFKVTDLPNGKPNATINGLAADGRGNVFIAIDQQIYAAGYMGDVNGDYTVDQTDLLTLDEFIDEGEGPLTDWADLTGDGTIDKTDYDALVALLGVQRKGGPAR